MDVIILVVLVVAVLDIRSRLYIIDKNIRVIFDNLPKEEAKGE